MSDESKDPAVLLMQALSALSSEDRDAVLIWLLRGSIRGPGMPPVGMLSRVTSVSLGSGSEFLTSYVGSGRPGARPQQVVPVRFPAEQHTELRDWCAEHGFSMATVIRGLVTRFLDTQRPERN